MTVSTTLPDLSIEAFTVWLESDLDALLDQPRDGRCGRSTACVIAEFITWQGFSPVTVGSCYHYLDADLQYRHAHPAWAVTFIAKVDHLRPRTRRDALALLKQVTS